MKISLIVSTYKNTCFLNKVFVGLQAQTALPAQIIIAEDAQDDDTKSCIDAWRQKFSCKLDHVSQEDLGFRKSSILNQAILKSDGDYILFLDGDCVPEKNFIADHMREAELGMYVQGRRAYVKFEFAREYEPSKGPFWLICLKGQGYGWLKANRLLKRTQVDQKLRGILGCNMGIWKTDLMEINGFNEDMEGWGKEDSEMVVRLYKKGLKRKMVYGRCIVYHLDHDLESREHLEKNNSILEDVHMDDRFICDNGIVKHSQEI